MPLGGALTIGAIGVGAGGAVLSGIGGLQQASAMQAAARTNQQLAQASMGLAQQQVSIQQGIRAQTLGYAQMSPEELGMMSQYLNQSSAFYQQSLAQISSQEQVLASYSPTFRAAGQQALDLLQGKAAAALAPINQQRALQRQQLESSLRQQLGPGYATSSAGVQAMNNFDMETQQYLVNAQQSTLQQMMSYSQAGLAGEMGARGQIAQTLGQAQAAQQNTLGNILNYQGGIQQRLVGASMGSPISLTPLMQANQGLMQAGWQQAQTQGAQLQTLGGMFAGMGQAGMQGADLYNKQQLINKLPTPSSGYGTDYSNLNYGNYRVSGPSLFGTATSGYGAGAPSLLTPRGQNG